MLGGVIMVNITTFDNPFDKFTLDEHACFLCGDDVRHKGTKEHVFPQWLLKDYNLRHEQLTLLNGSLIRYNQLTIPCCSECNNNSLSSLEKKIKESVLKGYDSVVDLPKLEIFQWLGKIFYGILRKELSLPTNQKSASRESIIHSDTLSRFSCLHAFLQSINRPFEFPLEEPFSVLVAKLHTPNSNDLFYFRDNLQHMTCSIRMGDVGIIIALDDGGLLRETYQKYLDEVNGRPLAPIQFNELYAKCLYQVSLIRLSTKFAIHTNGDEGVTVNMIGRGYVDEWCADDFAPVLEGILKEAHPGLATSLLDPETNLLMTWMNNKKGEITLIDEEGELINKT